MRYPFLILILGVLGLACNKQAEPVATSKPSTTTPVATAPEYDLTSLARDLKSTSAQRRETAIKSALELDENEVDVIPTLLEALKDSTGSTIAGDTGERPTSTRETAVQALLKLGTKGKKALQDKGLKSLVEGTKDSKATVREHAVNAIGMVGTDAKSVIDAVVGLCADKDGHVRSASYRALQKIKNPPAVALVKLLTHEDEGVAVDAAAALSWVKPTGPDVVPPLLDALKLESTEKRTPANVNYIRNTAADVIAANTKHAEAAIPALVELLTKTTADQAERLFRPAKPGEKRGFSSGAVSALRRIGRPTMPAVLPLLKHEQPIVRYQAALVLSGMGNDAETAREAVMTALDEERGLPSAQLLVYEELALAALELGADPAKVAAQVAKLLSEDMVEVRIRAVYMLARLGRSASSVTGKLTELLNDLEPLMQQAVLEAFVAIGPSVKNALPEVIKKLEGEDGNTARSALKVIRMLGSEATLAVPALTKALSANDPNFCVEVIQTLGEMGPSAADAAPALTRMLDHESTRNEERLEILQTLAAIGPAAKNALPSVTKYTVPKEPIALRTAAVNVLGKSGTGNAEVLKKLVELLTDGQSVVRIAAMKAIALHGQSAKSAASNIKAMADKTAANDLKMWAAATLVVLGSDADAQTKLLSEALKNKKPEGRIARGAAADAVALLGPKAKPFVPELIDALKEKSVVANERVTLRERASKTMIALGEAGKEATSALSDLLRDNNPNIRKNAIEALGAIGPSAVLAVPKLKDLARAEPALAPMIDRALDRINPPKKMDE